MGKKTPRDDSKQLMTLKEKKPCDLRPLNEQDAFFARGVISLLRSQSQYFILKNKYHLVVFNV